MIRTVCHWLCLAAIPATLLLAGCSTPIARSVVQANLAQEQAANQLLLLNIARAHERMPMHFSQIGQIRAAPGGWGLGLPSLELELPFGGEASRAYTLTAGNEGQTPVDVSALYNQEFMRGITTPVTADTVAYFANQGWPTAMLMHLFFESITTVGADDKVIDRIVNNPGGPGYGRFRDVVKNAAGCELAAEADRAQRHDSCRCQIRCGDRQGRPASGAGDACRPAPDWQGHGADALQGGIDQQGSGSAAAAPS